MDAMGGEESSKPEKINAPRLSSHGVGNPSPRTHLPGVHPLSLNITYEKESVSYANAITE